ncbi:WD40-repeat-containing domain protein [Lipomyces japonicus]|uniref:WD40-repeat-containing domain protein n=1 Tax=Lipomyces japonicus TaxID=56871 RepID=UPI0034CDB2DF
MDNGDEEEEELRNFLPASFGKKEQENNFEHRYDQCRREFLPPQHHEHNSDESDDDDDDDISLLPLTHQFTIKQHAKTVSALDVDPAGTRLLSGSYDYHLNLYDFASMSLSSLSPFRSFEPADAHLIHAAKFSPSGDAILVITGSSQAKVFSRDGKDEREFVRGDMYLTDMHNTSGHVAELTSAAWCPWDRNLFVTSSADSTVRVWDQSVRRRHRDLIVYKSKTGRANLGLLGKPKVTAVAWQESSQARTIVAATDDGALSYWPVTGPLSRPAGQVAAAHEPGTWTSGVTCGADGTTVLTRGGDHSVKLWDTRNFSRPVLVRTGLRNQFQETDVSFGPDERFIVTGTSATPQSPGQVHVLDKTDLSTITTVDAPSPSSSVVRTAWHAKLNQIFASTSSGEVLALFSRELSSRGAKLVVERAAKVKHVDDDVTANVDMSAVVGSDHGNRRPHHQQNGTGVTGSSRQKTKNDDRRDPVKTRAPELPYTGIFARNNPDEQHIKQNVAIQGLTEDPRDALLKYAKKAEEEPIFFKVYKKNQPKPIFAEPEDDDEDDKNDDDDKKNYKRLRRR